MASVEEKVEAIIFGENPKTNYYFDRRSLLIQHGSRYVSGSGNLGSDYEGCIYCTGTGLYS